MCRAKNHIHESFINWRDGSGLFLMFTAFHPSFSHTYPPFLSFFHSLSRLAHLFSLSPSYLLPCTSSCSLVYAFFVFPTPTSISRLPSLSFVSPPSFPHLHLSIARPFSQISFPPFSFLSFLPLFFYSFPPSRHSFYVHFSFHSFFPSIDFLTQRLNMFA